jgi:Zn-dependent M28 family amino/carboxypeptidase
MSILTLFAHALALMAGPTPADVGVRVVGSALANQHAYGLLAELTDRVGPRLTGSPGAARGVEWGVRTMKAAGLANVHTEPVRVQKWVRGAESFELVAPIPYTLHATALGRSLGTPKGGVTAEVIEVGSPAALLALGDRARGKVVFYNIKPVERSQTGANYGPASAVRWEGGQAAAKAGAVAALLRSAGSGAYRLPHTGATNFEGNLPRVPFAALSAEDADLLHRLLTAGQTVRVKMEMDLTMAGETDSANVVGDLPGSGKLANQIVLLGAHLDSWDLGQGAIDDGAGCVIVLEAARLLHNLSSAPRRTVRVVLFMDEESGSAGGSAYTDKHANELDRHVAALEMDAGGGRPTGFSASAGTELLRAWVEPLAGLRLGEVKEGAHGGADLRFMAKRGVPMLSVNQDMTQYFDWHHTAADTLDKVDPVDLALNVAAVAALAWGAADSAQTLPRLPPRPEPSP